MNSWLGYGGRACIVVFALEEEGREAVGVEVPPLRGEMLTWEKS